MISILKHKIFQNTKHYRKFLKIKVLLDFQITIGVSEYVLNLSLQLMLTSC